MKIQDVSNLGDTDSVESVVLINADCISLTSHVNEDYSLDDIIILANESGTSTTLGEVLKCEDSESVESLVLVNEECMSWSSNDDEKNVVNFKSHDDESTYRAIVKLFEADEPVYNDSMDAMHNSAKTAKLNESNCGEEEWLRDALSELYKEGEESYNASCENAKKSSKAESRPTENLVINELKQFQVARAKKNLSRDVSNSKIDTKINNTRVPAMKTLKAMQKNTKIVRNNDKTKIDALKTHDDESTYRAIVTMFEEGERIYNNSVVTKHNSAKTAKLTEPNCGEQDWLRDALIELYKEGEEVYHASCENAKKSLKVESRPTETLVINELKQLQGTRTNKNLSRNVSNVTIEAKRTNTSEPSVMQKKANKGIRQLRKVSPQPTEVSYDGALEDKSDIRSLLTVQKQIFKELKQVQALHAQKHSSCFEPCAEGEVQTKQNLLRLLSMQKNVIAELKQLQASRLKTNSRQVQSSYTDFNKKIEIPTLLSSMKKVFKEIRQLHSVNSYCPIGFASNVSIEENSEMKTQKLSKEQKEIYDVPLAEKQEESIQSLLLKQAMVFAELKLSQEKILKHSKKNHSQRGIDQTPELRAVPPQSKGLLYNVAPKKKARMKSLHEKEIVEAIGDGGCSCSEQIVDVPVIKSIITEII